MTHEELLDRISDYVDSDCDCPKCERQYAPFRGLYAVIKLHRPEAQEHGQYEKCWNCNLLYPCPTIQAIEGKMG